MSSPVHSASSASLPVSIVSTPAAKEEDRVRRREQQTLFEDVVQDAFPIDFEWYEEPVPGALPTARWTINCLLPPGARNDHLEVKYGQRQLALQTAFIWDSHHAK